MNVEFLCPLPVVCILLIFAFCTVPTSSDRAASASSSVQSDRNLTNYGEVSKLENKESITTNVSRIISLYNNSLNLETEEKIKKILSNDIVAFSRFLLPFENYTLDAKATIINYINNDTQILGDIEFIYKLLNFEISKALTFLRNTPSNDEYGLVVLLINYEGSCTHTQSLPSISCDLVISMRN